MKIITDYLTPCDCKNIIDGTTELTKEIKTLIHEIDDINRLEKKTITDKYNGLISSYFLTDSFANFEAQKSELLKLMIKIVAERL